MLLLPLEALRLADNNSEALALIELLIDSLALIDSDSLLLMLALSNPACDSLVLLSPFEVLRLADNDSEALALADADALSELLKLIEAL